MDPTRIGIFDLAEKRMAWAEQRQAVLAKNIANANTPSFQASDVPDFAKTLSRVSVVEPVRTRPNHMSGTDTGGILAGVGAKHTGRGPDGNTVALDEQLTRVADTDTTQAMTTAIYKKYLGLFNIVLGQGG